MNLPQNKEIFFSVQFIASKVSWYPHLGNFRLAYKTLKEDQQKDINWNKEVQKSQESTFLDFQHEVCNKWYKSMR